MGATLSDSSDAVVKSGRNGRRSLSEAWHQADEVNAPLTHSLSQPLSSMFESPPTVVGPDYFSYPMSSFFPWDLPFNPFGFFQSFTPFAYHHPPACLCEPLPSTPGKVNTATPIHDAYYSPLLNSVTASVDRSAPSIGGLAMGDEVIRKLPPTDPLDGLLTAIADVLRWQSMLLPRLESDINTYYLAAESLSEALSVATTPNSTSISTDNTVPSVYSETTLFDAQDVRPTEENHDSPLEPIEPAEEISVPTSEMIVLDGAAVVDIALFDFSGNRFDYERPDGPLKDRFLGGRSLDVRSESLSSPDFSEWPEGVYASLEPLDAAEEIITSGEWVDLFQFVSNRARASQIQALLQTLSLDVSASAKSIAELRESIISALDRHRQALQRVNALLRSA